MRINGTSDTVLPLTKKQKCACNIVMGIVLIATGIILVLSGVGVIKASVRTIAAPTVLFGFGAAVLLSAIIAKNSLSIWLAGVVLDCGLVSLLVAVTAYGYGELFPVYFAAPAVGCALAIWFAEAKFPQVKAIIFFGAVCGILALGSFGVCGFGLAAGLLAAFIGLCVVAYAIESYLKKDDVDNA